MRHLFPVYDDGFEQVGVLISRFTGAGCRIVTAAVFEVAVRKELVVSRSLELGRRATRAAGGVGSVAPGESRESGSAEQGSDDEEGQESGHE